MLKSLRFPIAMLLLLPLVASLGLGYLFSGHQVSHIPTAILDEDNSSLSRTLVRTITTNDVFDVQQFPQGEAEVDELLTRGEVATAIILPRGFSDDLVQGRSPRVLVFYDGSQLSITGAAKSRIAEVLSTVKVVYLMRILEGKLGVVPDALKSALTPIGSTTRYIGNPTKNSANSVLEGLLFNIIQIALAVIGVEIITNTTRFRDLRAKSFLMMLFGCLAVLLVFLTQSLLFAVPFRSTPDAAVLLTLPFVVATVNLGSTIRLLTGDRGIALTIAGFLSVTFLLSGYTFPTFAMPEILQVIVQGFPYTHFGPVMRDVALIGKSSLDVLPEALWLTGFAVVLLFVNFLLFRLRVPRKAAE